MGEVWRDLPRPQGLYDPRNEHDACGIGFVANIKGKRSYGIVDDALKILENLKHRGGEGADQKSGDGAGILTQIPHEFFRRECEVLGFHLPAEGEYGVGMIFAHRYRDFREEQKRVFEEIVKEEGQQVLGWREVPIDESLIGEEAKRIRPHFLQVFIGRNSELSESMDFERKLYIIRRRAEKKIIPLSEGMGTDFYIASLSSRTIVYKGMLTSDQMRHFYLDLSDLDFKTAMAMVHSRFSTNTFPSWARAHPNRYIVHNGEINTIRGNINWLNAREGKSRPSDYPELARAFPVVDVTGSDSAMFDNCLEYLHMAGHSMAHAMMVMIPEPWEKDPSMSREKKDFYRYHNFMMEPWDGPAAICFCDGITIGGMLDRNGLRPARYYVMKDDRVILSSEVGSVPVNQEDVLYKGRLEPGKIFLIDTSQQRIVGDEEIKHTMAKAHPYGTWCKEHILDLKDLPKEEMGKPAPARLEEEQRAFGYTQEDMRDMIIPMAQTGKDPVGAMGMDSPLPVLSERPRLLYDYFQQNFAQVTNPPIDAIREKIVTSSTVYVGNMANIMDPDEKGTAALAMDRPLLTNEEMEAVKHLQDDRLRPVVLSLLYPEGKGEMEKALEALFAKSLEAVKKGHNILILSDRGVDREHLAIPALLASAGLHNFLIREKVRPDVGIILESGEPREVHHFCTLIGYGATAINPYLALDTARDLAAKGRLGNVTEEDALQNYMDAAVKGILSVMSKMGISTVKSYHGAQIFEAVGIGREVADTCFGHTTSPVGGLGMADLEEENRRRHEEAYGRKKGLPAGDVFKYRRNGDEPHILSAEAIRLLQQACRTGSYELYKVYAKKVNEPLIRLRDLLDFTYPAGCSIPIEEVESTDSLIRHFRTGAMSYGALSREAHECIAKAMNALHSRSNTGEGGEDAERFEPLPDGSSMNDEIKQVSTARFGVTGNYLVHGSEIQIKCAQGAKPGEGGHLPGSKVDPAIARTRRSTPGVSLISPPPHHDVYSIEDLAELIFDLKNANPRAEINVKLTAGSGVGTIAAGVVKAKADGITISGYDGGTGASPRTSMRHAGLPWEIGLAEVQQVLLLNQLRDRVKLETDGKLLTGRDVAIAALLGAELFSFCTGPLIALGCQMYRVCNRNTCPLGICTQNEKLRKRFAGKPEYVENFMRFVAEDLREIMARLGFHTLEEMVGRNDRLKQKGLTGNPKADTLNLDALLFRPYTDISVGHHFMKKQDHEMEKTLDMAKLVRMCKPALDEGKPVRAKLFIQNTNRVTGTLVGSEISRRYGEEGLPEDTIHLSFVGSAGQSFGAFIPRGLTLTLEGDANDYAGKGLSGGKIIIYPPREAAFKAEDNVIIGNVAFFGATGGKAFVSGRAGERFCVRNSGATVVVEGVGNHGLEYMTGGKAVILGRTGLNLAAGMSGGIAYVVDLDERLVNYEMVHAEPLDNPEEAEEVRKLIEEHYICTRSERAEEILAQWNRFLPRISRIIPKDYEAMETEIRRLMKQGKTREEAEKGAFEEKFGK
ncbi:glutamate synthase large subunit [uncultured Dialister sp.]|uniref:glutamate synthase large subunit n=1 Tax=uncultured Dialister sp. TaxID=278064 RepID=UPI00267600FD|nr:glutamate synthase large subunit [uncultured Dialister sp.]